MATDSWRLMNLRNMLSAAQQGIRLNRGKPLEREFRAKAANLERQIQQLGAGGRPMRELEAAPAVGAGWSRAEQYGRPEFHGVEDFEALQQELYEEQMAGVRQEFGRMGTLAGSEFAGTTAAAMAGAQRTRWGLEAQEMGRRTGWERDLALAQWQLEEQAARRRATAWQTERDRALRREALEAEVGRMRSSQWFGLAGTLQEAWPQAAAPRQAFIGGGQGFIGGRQRLW